MSSSQAVSKEALDLLVSMGFTEEESRAALLATQGDANAAIEMLSRGDGLVGDAEFDLIAQAETEPSIHEPTVFQPRTFRTEADHFKDGSDTIAEMVDSRVSSLVSMGFSATDAENALKRCNNDVNEALNLLLQSS